MPSSLSGWDELSSLNYTELKQYFDMKRMKMNESYLIKNASRRTAPDQDYILQNKFRVLSTSLCAETYEEAVELAQQQVNDNNRIYIIEVIAYVESAKAPVRVVKLR